MTAPDGKTSAPTVSILVVAYRNPELTCACLKSVTDQIDPAFYELLVLDNASGDGTAQVIAERFPAVSLEASSVNHGFARGNNLLASRARGRYLLLLNPDTVVWPGCVEALAAFADAHPEGGLYGGRTMSPTGELEPSSCWGAPTLWSLFCFATGLSTARRGSRLLDPESLGPWRRDSARPVDIVTGCLALISRELWNRLGGFDESFWMYGEDADLSLRVSALGYQPMITPEATITHVIGASSASGGKMKLVMAARAALLRKHWSPTRAAIGTQLLALGCGLRSIKGSNSAAWREAWRARGAWSAARPTQLSERRGPIALAASAGGHLELLVSQRSVVAPEDRVWITIEGTRADTLRREGERVHTVPSLDRERRDLRNVTRGVALAWRLRPRLVITSGAGLVVPFAVAARLLGSRIVFIETMARVSSPSLSGRLLGRLSHRSIVQWPELLPYYSAGELCRPPLLPRTVPPPAADRAGTFVTVGTHSAPFTRMLRVVDEAAAAGLLPRPVIAQVGPATGPFTAIEARPWLDRDTFQTVLAGAEVVIGHCGAGFLGSAISLGQRPLVMPRLATHGEHVDDHQLQLCDKLSALGLIVRLDESLSAALVAQAAAGARPSALPRELPELPDLLAAEIAGR